MDSSNITTIFATSINSKSFMKTWKVKEIISFIEADGWFLFRTRGDHRQFKHPVKKGKVTVPGKLSEDLDPNTAKSILKQAGAKIFWH